MKMCNGSMIFNRGLLLFLALTSLFSCVGYAEKNAEQKSTPSIKERDFSKAFDVKDPRWLLREGGQYAMCQELAALLNDLPGDKHLGMEFPFSEKYPKFKPVPMKPVGDIEPLMPVLDEWFDKYMSRIRPPGGVSQEERRQGILEEWRQYAKSDTPLVFEGYIDLYHNGTKSHVLWVRRKDNALPPSDYWWKSYSIMSQIIIIESDGSMDDRSNTAASGGYPIYYDGRYRALRWGGTWLQWSKRPYHGLTAFDVSLYEQALIKEDVCKIEYHFEMEF